MTVTVIAPPQQQVKISDYLLWDRFHAGSLHILLIILLTIILRAVALILEDKGAKA